MGQYGYTGSHRRVYLALLDLSKRSKNSQYLSLAYRYDALLTDRHLADYDFTVDMNTNRLAVFQHQY